MNSKLGRDCEIGEPTVSENANVQFNSLTESGGFSIIITSFLRYHDSFLNPGIKSENAISLTKKGFS